METPKTLYSRGEKREKSSFKNSGRMPGLGEATHQPALEKQIEISSMC